MAPTHIFVEGNMDNILETILVNISKNPKVIENIFMKVECSLEEIKIYTNLFEDFIDVFAWTYQEILGIDPSILQHEINIYKNAKHVCRKIWPVNPRKVVAIEAKVEKLLNAVFIYPVP